MNVRALLRDLTPYGLVNTRHRRFRLSRLNLPNSQAFESAVESCRFDLWPESLRNAPMPWTLVDVGANIGDFVNGAASLKSFESVYAFEPQPSCHADLRQILQTIPRSTLIPSAVGRCEGSLELHVTANSRMASGLRPEARMDAAYASDDFAVTEKITVSMVTLDSAIPDDVEIGLLKIDVQGFEIEVLAGAASTLQRTRAILAEVNYVQHYENGATFNEIYTELHALGFQLFGVSAPFMSTKAEPLWADAIFVNTKL